MQEFSDQATGIGVTFKPTIIGFGAVLDNLSAFVDRTGRPAVIVGAAAVYILLWIFLAGGIIDRLARDRPTRDVRVLLRLWGVFLPLPAPGRGAVARRTGYCSAFCTRGCSIRLLPAPDARCDGERTAFLIRLAMYGLFGVAVAACTVVFDYSKVRAVVEDRRSAIGAIAAALGFLKRHAERLSVCFS